MSIAVIAQPTESWSAPLRFPDLAGSCIHVWFLDLSGLVEPGQAARLLSPAELSRARRFRLDRDRLAYIARRAVLRQLLAGYLRSEAGSLQFVHGSQGKPALAASQSGERLYFNLSHSGRAAIFAVTRLGEIGIDLESIQPMAGLEKIAEHFFSGREVAALRHLPSQERLGAFFACWTRKEAFIKALGGGLSISLDSFEVSLLPGQPARILHVRHDPEEARRWSLYDLRPARGYAAALAAPAQQQVIHTYRWPQHDLCGEDGAALSFSSMV